jgi:glutamyl-tRNA synthetase
MTVVTRFAPSPTGYMHIGNVRTALFNWLYAKHHGGKYLMRIEDTDKERSTQEAVDVIFNSLEWLGLTSDEKPYIQSNHAERHVEVAKQLLDSGHAFKCYCTSEEVEKMREEARASGKPMRYDGRCRNAEPQDKPYVVRFKAPQDGETVIEDLVQGKVTIANKQLDDMVLLRTDGTPTYMLSVVVDDYDMQVTHIIRGDDHLTNAFRQFNLYKAMGWTPPHFAHIPLIHGPDGAKLSKRHGALSAESYKDMGFVADAMVNYLLRLGWGHGDDEIISRKQAIEWFDVEGIGKSPSRFDMDKLTNLNGHYIREMDDGKLLDLLIPFIKSDLTEEHKRRILKGLPGLKSRAKTLIELAENAMIYVHDEPTITEEAQAFLSDDAKQFIHSYIEYIEPCNFEESALEEATRTFAEQYNLKLGKLAQPLRAALTGNTVSPSVFEIMAVLGKDESLKRLSKV